jgi:selenocysteine lyase/cysteine desulfurase
MPSSPLRSRFPLLERTAYLNAGTNGPVAVESVQAAELELGGQLDGGRAVSHFERRASLQKALRSAYAGVLGCDPGEVALTTSTSDGLGRVLAGLDLGRGDEILTSDQEHPGLLGPLSAARGRGARIRTAPLATIAERIEASTTLVACSHVGWIGGELADPRLAHADVPVVLDGAQGAGAIALDVRALGCAAYAAAGQKWMCGADGSGMLYVARGLFERLAAIAPSYDSFADTSRGLDSPLRDDARRHDTPALARESVAFNLAAHEVLTADGWPTVHRRSRELAATLASALRERGRIVAPRGETTLVAWEDDEPAATRVRLAAAGIVVRDLPRTPYLRASVGAWNDEGDIDRLLSAL